MQKRYPLTSMPGLPHQRCARLPNPIACLQVHCIHRVRVK